MLEALTIILACQLLGESIVVATGLPLPGPVVGMAILFIGLLVRGGVPKKIGQVAGSLLDHLSLLFVPAGVGVMTHLSLLEREWWPISLSLVLSTLLTIAVTAGVMNFLIKYQERRRNDGEKPR